MSAKVASIYAEASLKDNLTPKLKDIKGGLSDFGEGLLKGVGRLVGITSAAAIAGLAIKGIKLSVDAAAESQAGLTRLKATLTATGRSAEISVGQIDRVAGSLMAVSTFDDEAIVNAYNTLLKFESIPVGNLEQITKTAMDMSAAMGGDLVSNADALGRALETGVIPRTWGFSAALKEQFAAQVKAGDSAGALTLMMDELNKRYGGQAVAQLNTYAGSTEALKVSMENLWEAIGEGLLDEGQTWNQWIKVNVDTLTRAVPKVYAYIDALNYARRQAGPPPVFNPGDVIASSRAMEVYNQKVQRLMQEYQAGLQTHEAWDVYLESERLGAEHLGEGLDDVADAAGRMNDAIEQTAWEVMYTDAENAAERSAQSMDWLGKQVQGIMGDMGNEGALVWNGFLAATGEISPAAAREFARVYSIFLTAESMLKRGIAVPIVVSFLVQASGGGGGADIWGNPYPTTPAVSGGGGTLTLAPWASEADRAYARAHPELYAPIPGEAGGGAFSGWAMVGDAPGGGKTPYTEYVYAPHGATVYNQSQMGGRSAPPMASGGVVSPMSNVIDLSPATIRELAFAFKVELAAVL